MALQYRDRLVSYLPELRRFTGALIAPGQTQSCGVVDDLVARSAAAVLRERVEGDTALRLALFSAVIRLAQSRDARGPATPAPPAKTTTADPTSFSEGLLSLQLQHRAALLLVSLEQMSYEDAAKVLGISRTFLVAKISTARQMLARRMEQAGDRPVTHLRLVK